MVISVQAIANGFSLTRSLPISLTVWKYLASNITTVTTGESEIPE